MFCNECGHENRNDRKFCAECGAKLKDYTKPVENVVMPQDIALEKEKVRVRNKISKTCNITFWTLLIASILLIVPVFFVKDIFKIVFICCSCFCFLSMIITLLVKKALLKNINKAD